MVLTNKVAVITGASRGIGAAIAERLSKDGAKIIVASNEGKVNEVAERINKNGGQAAAFEMDVTNKEDVIRLYDFAEEKFGRVDISVQNAGVITIAKIEELTEAEWNKVLTVNTTGVFLCCQEAIVRMRKHGQGGRLINTASGQARQGFIYTPHYAASKFGVMGITQSLAHEVAKEGITVNAFCPGIIETDMWAYNDEHWGKMLGNYKPGELMAEWVSKIPMGRAGTGEDVANVISFLAGPQSAYVTGQTINIDGGMFMS